MIGFSFGILAQSREAINIQVGSKSISADEQFTLSFSISLAPNAAEIVPIYRFPDLVNFKKLGVSRSKSADLVNGQIVNSLTFSQNYEPTSSGSFFLASTEIEVGTHNFKVESFTLTVTPGIPQEDRLLSDFPSDFVGPTNEPFFIVSSSQSHPYIGQSFTLKMSYFVPESNTRELVFDRNDVQIPELIQRIRPHTCWEENFGLASERVLKVQLNQKWYTEYRFFQATYFPLNAQVIRIPALAFQVLEVLGKGLEGIKKPVLYKSNAFNIVPKSLPNHPLSGKVPVGNFQLKELITSTNPTTGQKIKYTSIITGDGNSILWDSKPVDSDYFLDFSRTSFETKVSPFREEMLGNKTEIFEVIPKQPGKFVLGHYFKWIYFNVKLARFDTLKSQVILNVGGKPRDNRLHTEDDLTDLYRGIENKKTLEVAWWRWENYRQFVNLIVLFLGVIIVFLFLKTTK